ncbi:MAG: tail fiber domain-containing protein [Chitinophagaceae bacterium]|nr:tail fiber domain-containing protein [Chitinophagaceae bacterium]
MRKFIPAMFVLLLYLIFASVSLNAQVAINDNASAPLPSAMLDVNVFAGVKKGVLIPRMTTAQRTAIPAPATSLLVFDSNTNSFWFYGGAGPGWIEIIAGSNNLWAKNGNDIYNTNSANVGIGTGTTIKAKFHVLANNSVVFGPDSNTLGNSRFWFVGGKNALRIGTHVDIPFGPGAWDYANIGFNSLGVGSNNKIMGIGSIGIGDYNQTTEEGTAAFGWLNHSVGRGSFTTGYLNTANRDWSQAIGYSNTTHGEWSLTGGNGSFAWGQASFAFGTAVTSNSENMTTFGAYNDSAQYANANKGSWIATDPLFVVGNGTGSLAKSNAIVLLKNGKLGIGNTKPHARLHVAGPQTVIFGNDSLSSTVGQKFIWFGSKGALRFGSINLDGGNTWNIDNVGVNSIGIGEGALASGPQSFSQGYYSSATGFYSFARGFAASATGDHGMAFGQNLTSNGNFAHAFGGNTTVTGDYGFSNGYNNVVTGYFAGAFGQGLSARTYNAFVVGRYNDSLPLTSSTTWVAGQPVFVVGNGTASNARSNAMVVLKSGNVGIGTSFPSALLTVGSTTGADLRIGSLETFTDFGSSTLSLNATLLPEADNAFSLGSGSNRWGVVFAANGTINTSDARDKRNIKKLSYGLSDIMKLNPVSFEWNNSATGDGVKLGLIAQEVLKVIPEIVKTHETVTTDENIPSKQTKELSRYGIFYSDLIPVLVKSIQEQQIIITSQNVKIDDLEKRLKALEERLK